MAFTVLKTSKLGEHRIEVLGEFPDESTATRFSDDARLNDPTRDYDYTVEPPPAPNDTPHVKLF